MAAARGVTVLHNSRDTIHIVLNVDGTCSSMTAWGRTGRYLVRGSWPAGFSLEKQPKFVMSINLPALFSWRSLREGRSEEARVQQICPHPSSSLHTWRCARCPRTPLEFRRKTCVLQACSPSIDTRQSLSPLDAKCPHRNSCASAPLSPITAIRTWA